MAIDIRQKVSREASLLFCIINVNKNPKLSKLSLIADSLRTLLLHNKFKEATTMNIKEIGLVKRTENGSIIKLRTEYVEGLNNIEGFGHLVVLWWAHLVDSEEYREILSTNKPYKTGPENIGVFATRSQLRPNPIGMSIINVTNIDYTNGIIYTSYIDAEEDTPVLDIKPYYPCSDVVKYIKMPDWCSHLPKCIEESASFDWENYFNF